MILNLKILKNHKILSKGREQAAELLASVSKIFDIPQPSYSYVEKKDISVPAPPTQVIPVPAPSSGKKNKNTKKAKVVDDSKNKFFVCEVSARIPTPIYELKLLREKKQHQKNLLKIITSSTPKQNQEQTINGQTNHVSNNTNGIHELLPINGSTLENTTNKSTMIQTKIGEHVPVPITFSEPTKAKKGDLYHIYGAGESDTKNSARNLAALEVIYQVEQMLNIPRGGLPDHLQMNSEKLQQLADTHHSIPYNEAIPGITWQNIPIDSSFAAFHPKIAPRHFVPATRAGNIDFMTQIMINEYAVISAKAITLASSQRLPTLDVHSNTMAEGSIQRFANVQASGGPLEGVVGPLPGGELNIGLDRIDATVVALIYMYNKMTHEPTQVGMKRIVKERYLSMVKEIIKERDTSYGMAKLFVSLPRHQFPDLNRLIDTIPIYTLPGSYSNMIRRRQPQRRYLRHHGNQNSYTNKNVTVDRERQQRIETFRQHQKSQPLPVDSVEKDIPYDVSVTIVRGGTGSGKVRISFLHV